MIDLHLHTKASDGELTPSELVKMAYDAGINTIAVTDHDTVRGIEEALEAGSKYNVNIIPGIEISTSYPDVQSEIHLIGLFINHKNETLKESLNTLSIYRKNRNMKLLERFNEINIKIDCDILFDNGSKSIETVGKPDFARALLLQNFTNSDTESYGKYLDDKTGLVRVKKEHLIIKDAICMIHNAGGIAILAHPFHISKNFNELNNIVSNLTDDGLDGIEVFYNNYDRKQVKTLKTIARNHGLIKSGGSDLHFVNSSRGSRIGFYGVKKNIPDSILKEMPFKAT